MSTLLTVKQVKSLTIGFALPETYDTGRIEEIKVYLGKNVHPHTIDGRIVKCQIKSDDTSVMYGVNRLSFWLDDSIIGVYPVYCGDIVFEYTNAIEHNESVNTLFDVMVNLTISETAITVDSVLYNILKGDKGDTGNYGVVEFVVNENMELEQRTLAGDPLDFSIVDGDLVLNEDGETVNLGKIGVIPKGEWSNLETYNKLDLVTSTEGSYLSLKDGNTSAIDTADWLLLAKNGIDGYGAVLQELGLSETDVMSQKAVTDELALIGINTKNRDNSVSLNGSIDFVNNADGTLSVSLSGDKPLFTRNKFIGLPIGTTTCTDYFCIYVNPSDLIIKSVAFSSLSLKENDIILFWGSSIRPFKIDDVIYSASRTIKIDNVSFTTGINKMQYDLYADLRANNVVLRDGIDYNTITGVVKLGDNVLFSGNKYFIISGSVTIPTNDFYKICYNKTTTTLSAIKFNVDIDSNYITLAVICHQPESLLQDKILYCAANKYWIDGVKYDNFVAKAAIENSILALSNTVNQNKIDQTSEILGKTNYVSLRDPLYIDIPNKTVSWTDANYIFYGRASSSTNANSSVTVATSDFYIIYTKPLDKGLFAILHTNSSTIPIDAIVLAIINFQTPGYVYYCAAKTFYIDGVKYDNYYTLPSTMGGSTNLKYAEIGDSITFLADNKYETSYDDRGTSNTGYKGWGYGRYFCKAMGISYGNHYPQGANGRTFCDYLDEWNQGNWDWPNDTINFWTIFLGTNDWGTERHALGTTADYINNTYTLSNRTTYGAIRQIIDKIRSKATNTAKPQIVFITPIQRGAFAYGSPLDNFMKSAIKVGTGGYEYVENSYGFTLKDVVDAIKWVCDYESLSCIDLFNDSVVDKKYLNMSQQLSEIDPANWIYQDVLYDNLHPTAIGFKKIGARLIEFARKFMYDIVAKQ